MNLRERHVAQTRTAILDALAAEIVASGMLRLSMQRVADRAGVTHRTLYNYFPTREALNDAFAAHVEQMMVEAGTIAPELDPAVASLPAVTRRAYEMLGENAPLIRAYVMMTLASGVPAQVFRERSAAFERRVDSEHGPLPPGTSRVVTSAIRLIASSAGWYLMTAHHGLTGDQAGRVGEWAVRVLLDAVRDGDLPEFPEDEE